MPTLTESTAIVIYNDATATNNPQQRYVDWRRNLSNVVVKNPLDTQYIIPPNTSQVLFNGSRTTTIDNTTVFSIALNPINSNVYRFTWTGGTAPGFRTDRGLTLSGDTATIAVNNNATVTLTIVTNNFNAVQIGDTVWIPTAATGDASVSSPFNVQNGGAWQVIGKASGGTPKTITMVRPAGTFFSAVAETQTITSNNQLLAFSSSGVQLGDSLEISSGFSPVTQTNFTVSNVTSQWVEVTTSLNYPLETGIQPTNSGMTFYLGNKKFKRVEVDQPAIVRLNGDVGNSTIKGLRLDPLIVADQNNIGYFEALGTCWALEVVNRSQTSVLHVTVLSAEQ